MSVLKSLLLLSSSDGDRKCPLHPVGLDDVGLRAKHLLRVP